MDSGWQWNTCPTSGLLWKNGTSSVLPKGEQWGQSFPAHVAGSPVIHRSRRDTMGYLPSFFLWTLVTTSSAQVQGDTLWVGKLKLGWVGKAIEIPFPYWRLLIYPHPSTGYIQCSHFWRNYTNEGEGLDWALSSPSTSSSHYPINF